MARKHGLQPFQNLIRSIVAQDLSGQQHFQNFSVTLQLRMEMLECAQIREYAKAKPAVSVQQVLYQDIEGRWCAHPCEDHRNLLAHLDGYRRVAEMIAQATAYRISEFSQHFRYVGHELRVS